MLTQNQYSAPLLAGRRILVVGAGRQQDLQGPLSNGYAISLALAQSAATVMCADRDIEAAQRTATDINAAGGSAAAVHVDVRELGQVPGMIERAVSSMGGLDGLVMNVGISHRKPLDALTADSWDEVLNVNTRAHLFCAKYALPRMDADGSVVFVSSTASRRPGGRNPAYEASKAALSAVCRAVALEGQPRGIRANVVVLGLIDTPMGRSATQSRSDRLKQPLPFGRQGTAEEVAAATRFLLSRDASYVNAVELLVDGGMSAGVVLHNKGE